MEVNNNYTLIQTWRWFGQGDTVPLSAALQAGAEGIVSALHHIKCGDVWTVDEILKHKNTIEKAGLHWAVVESVPVHEQIKKGSANRDHYINNYIQSLHALAKCGIKTVCYNFMPILDWTRTDTDYELTDGSKALLFDNLDYIAFETEVLKRDGAIHEFDSKLVAKAQKQWYSHTDEKRAQIIKTTLLGLPGTVEDLTLDEFKEQLAAYQGIDENILRKNYAYFLSKIIPEAEYLGVNMTVHPDDPPKPIFGLPRIMSTEADVKWLTEVNNSPANGLCFCTGSFGAHIYNDLPGMVERWGDKINFLHLRSVQHTHDGSFYEANHLEGNANMPAVMYKIVQLMHKRKMRIPMRPDHGHQMLDDLHKKNTYFGYSAIGRLRGLAELRGLEMGIHTSLIH
ncbi:MAG: mannonate dehydratase [Cytophagales bacterium]|nr:mannonate dehydratase [Cytophagales bacterium]